MALFADVTTTIVSVVLVIILLALVPLFLRWSQRNIKANTQRIKQQLSEEAAGPGLVLPPNVSRAEGETPEEARELSGDLDGAIAAVYQRLDDVEQRLARLEQAAERFQRQSAPAAEPNPPGDRPAPGETRFPA